MNIISSIIATLSKEDKKKFLLVLKQKNKRKDTKNIELFHLLDTQVEQKNLDQFLYGKSSKGAYHAVCKRLHDSLIDFIAMTSFEGESSNEMNALKLLLSSRIFFEGNHVKLAFKTIAKAESMAVKNALYSILSEIYHTKIQYAHLNSSLDLIDLINKFQQNKLKILEEENLNLFYATIHNELKNNPLQITDIISRNLDIYGISISQNLSYQSLFKILEISNQVAHVTRDYYAVLQFTKEAYEQLENSEDLNNRHLYYRIQILYYMSNAFFRIKKFKTSAKYLEFMHSYMRLQNNKYDAVFYPRYELIKNLLLIYTGKAEEAIDNLKVFDFEKYKSQLSYLLDLKLTLVAALFLQQKFKEAYRVYQDFYHSDTWYNNKTGIIWVIKKNLIEILLLIELDYLDLVGSRLKSFQKKYRVHLLDHLESRILEFLRLIMIYYYKSEDIHSKEFKKKVDLLVNLKSHEEDVFVISFYAWIKSKTESTDIYKTCLDYIKSI